MSSGVGQVHLQQRHDDLRTLTSEPVASVLKKLEADGDGSIAWAEFQAAVAEAIREVAPDVDWTEAARRLDQPDLLLGDEAAFRALITLYRAATRDAPARIVRQCILVSERGPWIGVDREHDRLEIGRAHV